MGKGTLKALLERTTSGPNGGGEIKPRRYKFTIDKDACEKGVFDQDIEIVLRAPSADIELRATRSSAADPITYTKNLVKMCIESIDGDPVSDSDLSRDALWEALGAAGRALLTTNFLAVIGPGDEATGKASRAVQLS